jgi:hypothetical protein
MAESKLPPGPWRWKPASNEPEVLGLIDAEENEILGLVTDSMHDWVIEGEPGVLRAIGALPTLVKAAKGLLANLRNHDMIGTDYRAAYDDIAALRDALAKIDEEDQTDG